MSDRIRVLSKNGVPGILGFAGLTVPWQPSALDRLALMILTAAARGQLVSYWSLLELIEECDRVALDVESVHVRANSLMTALSRGSRSRRTGATVIALCEAAISLGIERASLLELLRARCEVKP